MDRPLRSDENREPGPFERTGVIVFRRVPMLASAGETSPKRWELYEILARPRVIRNPSYRAVAFYRTTASCFDCNPEFRVSFDISCGSCRSFRSNSRLGRNRGRGAVQDESQTWHRSLVIVWRRPRHCGGGIRGRASQHTDEIRTAILLSLPLAFPSR